MTIEQKVRAIIRAQVRGGFKKHEYALKGYEITVAPGGAHVHFEKEEATFSHRILESEPYGGSAMVHVLDFLLDTEGMKATYGDDVVRVGAAASAVRWWAATDQILMGWHRGSNAVAAIEAAHKLLP